MGTLHVLLLSGEVVEVQLEGTESAFHVRAKVAAALQVPPGAVTLLQGEQRIQMSQKCDELTHSNCGIMAIIDGLEYAMKETLSTVLKAVKDFQEKIRHNVKELTVLQKIQYRLQPFPGMPLDSTYRRCLAKLQHRHAKAVVAHNDDVETNLSAEIAMLEHVWAMLRQYGSTWLRDQIREQGAELRKEIHASDLPGLIDHCLEDLMTYERFRTKEESMMHGRQLWHRPRPQTFKEKLVQMVNKELGEHSPFLENHQPPPFHFHDYYDYYYDYYDPYSDVDPEWTLWWRIDVENVKCHQLKDKACRLKQQEKKKQRSCIRVQQRLRGGHFKPGSRISAEECLD
eukprot:gnl/MRDRNA2_/MRDRNA2_91315_c0_seq1.p1 gnl/MRDRNA2_/MRDRNA2_91315_c0~~gnl/MRDRNA2_/MRDRNA2_91315_c0_seq1.p1  ORF type:complete len:370 (+),score=71.29 gnl/MRDRNA2_/MRDRNA2_91315_c0_seq1:86-1111(+)